MAENKWNSQTLLSAIREEYDAMRRAESQSESGLPYNYPSFEEYLPGALQAYGVAAGANPEDYSYWTQDPTGTNIRSYQVRDASGNTTWDNTYKDHGYNFWKNTALPAAVIWGGGALLGAAAAGGAAGAAGGGVAGSGGAAGGAAGSAGGLGSTGGLGGLGGVGGAAAGGGASATLPTVVVSGTSTGGGLGGLGGALGSGAAAGGAALSGSGGDAFQNAADEALQGSGNYYQQNPAQQWWTNVSNNAQAGGGGLTDYAGAIKDSIPGGVSNVASGIKNGSDWASLIGAGLGALDAGKGTSSSVANQIDPRMAAYLYGNGYGDANSLLGAAQQWWSQNKSGLNPTMQQGLDMQKSALTDPAYGQAYTQMRNVGTGLLGSGVAGNPFLPGQSTGSNAQNAFAGGGLLNPIELQAKGRGLLVM